MSNQPFMQLYVGDYLSDTTHLTTEQHGAYMLLLMTMWRHGAELPNNPEKLARIARLSPAKFKKIWAEIGSYFDVCGDTITNSRLAAEFKKATEKSAKRADAGRKGGSSKPLKRNNPPQANASGLLKHGQKSEVRIIEEPNGSLSSDDDFEAPAQPLDEVAEAVSAYNATAKDLGWPQVQVLSPARRSALRARLGECGGLGGWMQALARARASPHLCGHNERGWTANFDFLTRQSSFAKLMEGNYDDRSSSYRSQQRPPGGQGSGTVEAFAAVARRRAQGGA